MSTVITASGQTVSRSTTVKINNKYYLKGVEAVLASDEKWYRKESTRLVYNNQTETYEPKTTNHVMGVFFQDNEWKNGVFTKTSKSVAVRDVNKVMIEDSDIPELMRLNNSPDTLWVSDEFQLMNCDFIKYDSNSDSYKFSSTDFKFVTTGLPYEAKDCDMHGITNAASTFLSEKDLSSLKPYGDLLKYTIGVEYETSKGILATSLTNKLGLCKLRDGSLKGGMEYATIPFAKEQALFMNALIPTILDKTHDYNNRCSLHVHLGGFPVTKKHAVALWRICFRLQNEIAECLPNYRKTSQFAKEVTLEEGKDYCAPLPSLKLSRLTSSETDIKTAFNEVFRFLTNGISESSDYNFNNAQHPKKDKWQKHSR